MSVNIICMCLFKSRLDLTIRSTTVSTLSSSIFSSSVPSFTAAMILFVLRSPEQGISRSVPDLKSGDSVNGSTPVGYDKALKAPLFSEHLLLKPFIFRSINAVDSVIRFITVQG